MKAKRRRRKVIPVWDGERELRYKGVLVKLYEREAPEQQRVLAAFEEQGWPALIENPRQHLDGDNLKAQLKSLVNNMNCGMQRPLIEFLSRDAGHMVAWRPR